MNIIMHTNNRPVIVGLFLAVLLVLISTISVAIALISGSVLRSMLGVPAVVSDVLILALAILVIRLFIRKVIESAENNATLVLAIAVSPTILIAIAGFVRWIIIPASGMGAVMPALAAVTMTVYSVAIIVIGMRAIGGLHSK